jgi:hypothetical protein
MERVFQAGTVIFGELNDGPMRSFLSFIIIAALLTACSKDTFQSKPQLTLKSVSSTTVPAFGKLEIVLRLTDKEGDFKDMVYVMKTTTRCPSSNFIDSQLYKIPSDLPRTRNFDGDVVLSFTYPFELQPRCTRPDTATFRFWMRDAKGNMSDTAKTPAIIILRP